MDVALRRVMAQSGGISGSRAGNEGEGEEEEQGRAQSTAGSTTPRVEGDGATEAIAGSAGAGPATATETFRDLTMEELEALQALLSLRSSGAG
jgi:hypothetical protein